MVNSKGFEENLFYPYSIRTSTGIYLDLLNPTDEMFDIEDIAHALSQIPRFGGHLPYFYSVADHCISCACLNDGNDTKLVFDCLMHDASEAYLMDIPSPVKKLIPGYYELEDKIMKILSKKFKFRYPLISKVKEIDSHILSMEWNNIFIKKLNLFDRKIDSKTLFLSMYENYKPI